MDLNAPLGTTPPKRGGPRVVLILSVLAIAALCGGAGLLLWKADPRGGEPYAVAAIPAPPAEEPRPAAIDPTPTGSIARGSGDVVRMEHGVRVVSPMAAPSPARQTGPAVIDVSHALDEAARRTNAGSAATKPDAPTPTPSEDRSRDVAAREPADPTPATSGARTQDAAASPSTDSDGAGTAKPGARPRVAIFIGGMGLDANATRTATEIMPGAIDLAFPPGPSDPTQAVEAARSKGHEILLQMPMQTSLSAPASPHMLRPDETPADLAADLKWMMNRFGGYAGVSNLLGAPVMSRQDTMTAVLRAIGRAGLFFVDDGTSRESAVPALATSLGIHAVRADVVLDATEDPAVVRANLAKLAAIARRNGVAIGMASGLPDHMAAIAAFANDARSHGLDLVPVSAIAQGAAHLATSR